MTAGADLRAAARRIDAAKYRVVRSVGKVVDDMARTAARPATGGDAILTGKHRPIRLRTRTRIADTGGIIAAATVWGVPPGPWRWINDGTKPHDIRRRKRGPESKLTVHHPGMRGSGSWDHAELEARRRIPTLMATAVAKAVRG